MNHFTEMPFGWEKCVDEEGKVYYKNKETNRTTYTDPRLAFAIEEKDHPDDFRQRFDGSSTALQVLHGRDLSGKVAIVTGANTGIGWYKSFQEMICLITWGNGQLIISFFLNRV